MKNIVRKELLKFIDNENGLIGEEWKDNYFAPTNEPSIHVSEIDIDTLNNDDLLRFLMYLLLERDGAIERRIRGQRIYNKELDEDDDIMTVEDWNAAVEDGCFISNDGCGYWVKDGLACRDEVFNSEPEDATHMVWYNK